MTQAACPFVWYELMTSDTQAAQAFYTKVVGWAAQDSGVPDMEYTIFQAAGTPVGGMMTLPEDAKKAGTPPHWGGYIGVADVDEMAGRITKAGGAVHHAPSDIPGVGRFAVAADPQGALFMLFAPFGARPPLPAPNTPGLVGWHELHSHNWRAAFDFYAGLFGWTKADAIDMGPMGTYQLFATGAHPVGGMMTRADPAQPSAWLFYFNVDAIDPALARVTEAGGRVLMGPQQVPGGLWIVQGTDPQGAMFALVGPRPAG